MLLKRDQRISLLVLVPLIEMCVYAVCDVCRDRPCFLCLHLALLLSPCPCRAPFHCHRLVFHRRHRLLLLPAETAPPASEPAPEISPRAPASAQSNGRYPCGAAAGERLRAPSAAPPASEPAPEISPRAPASAQRQIGVQLTVWRLLDQTSKKY